jgi:hypothetical protein
MLFKNAKLKLVAGEVNMNQPVYAARARMAVMAYAEDKAANFQEKAFFEYHLYDLQRPTTIKNNQTKQIELLQAQGVSFEKEYLVTGNQSYFYSPYFPQNGNGDYKVPVTVNMKFVNSKANRLGQALPAGIMRFYKKDKDGAQVFIGSDAIQHTPVDEKVKVRLGEAFDIVAERKQTSYKQLPGSIHESQWEIILRNHKDEDVSVGVLEPFYGDWKITASSYPFVKQDAFSSRAEVKVPKKGEVKVTYTVQVKS